MKRKDIIKDEASSLSPGVIAGVTISMESIEGWCISERYNLLLREGKAGLKATVYSHWEKSHKGPGEHINLLLNYIYT